MLLLLSDIKINHFDYEVTRYDQLPSSWVIFKGFRATYSGKGSVVAGAGGVGLEGEAIVRRLEK